ncbi:hypothetical protein Bca4012_096501 [Brassica carinata]
MCSTAETYLVFRRLNDLSGFCNPLPLPAHPTLNITTFISSQPHRGTTAFIDAATDHVVLILSPNSIYFPVVSLAVMSLGAVVTTANTLNTAGERQ